MGIVGASIKTRTASETEAVTANIADSPEHLITPGSANYDWAVIGHHLDKAHLSGMPMTPLELQGTTPENARLQAPFSPHAVEGSPY